MLRIEAVDLPYIVVKDQGTGYLRGGPWTIDTRRCTLKRLSDAYIKALEGAP